MAKKNQAKMSLLGRSSIKQNPGVNMTDEPKEWIAANPFRTDKTDPQKKVPQEAYCWAKQWTYRDSEGTHSSAVECNQIMGASCLSGIVSYRRHHWQSITPSRID